MVTVVCAMTENAVKNHIANTRSLRSFLVTELPTGNSSRETCAGEVSLVTLMYFIIYR